MEKRQVSQDDLYDIIELKRELFKKIKETLEGNEMDIAMSALISATAETIVMTNNDIEAVMFYKRVFEKVLEDTIETIKDNRK